MIEGDKPKLGEIEETEREAFVGTVKDLIRTPRHPESPRGIVDTTIWESEYKKDGTEVLLRKPVPGSEDQAAEVSAMVKTPLFGTEAHTVFNVTEIICWPTLGKDGFKYHESKQVYDKKRDLFDGQTQEQDKQAEEDAIARKSLRQLLNNEVEPVLDKPQLAEVKDDAFLAYLFANQEEPTSKTQEQDEQAKKDAIARKSLQQAKSAIARGSDVVTPKRYNKIMEILKTLTPDDEVLPKGKQQVT